MRRLGGIVLLGNGEAAPEQQDVYDRGHVDGHEPYGEGVARRQVARDRRSGAAPEPVWKSNFGSPTPSTRRRSRN